MSTNREKLISELYCRKKKDNPIPNCQVVMLEYTRVHLKIKVKEYVKIYMCPLYGSYT